MIAEKWICIDKCINEKIENSQFLGGAANSAGSAFDSVRRYCEDLSKKALCCQETYGKYYNFKVKCERESKEVCK